MELYCVTSLPTLIYYAVVSLQGTDLQTLRALKRLTDVETSVHERENVKSIIVGQSESIVPILVVTTLLIPLTNG